MSILTPANSELPLGEVAMAVQWDGGGDGDSWHDPFNWSGDALPGAADDVVINVAGNPTITLGSLSTLQPPQ